MARAIWDLFRAWLHRLRTWDPLTWLALITVLLFSAFGWGIWYEATFDYSVCDASDTYRDRHSPAWVQQIPRTCTTTNNITTCTGGTTILHPARNWTERLYDCPNNEGGRFGKWRTERRP